MSGVRPFASEATRGARVALGGVILGTLLGVAGVSSPVLAYEASCVPGRGHDNAARYAVTSGHVSGINGLSSTILELNPYYSGSNSTGTNSSIMLLRWSPTQWAQLGWIKSKLYGGTVTRKVFLEFYLGPSQNYYRFGVAVRSKRRRGTRSCTRLPPPSTSSLPDRTSPRCRGSRRPTTRCSARPTTSRTRCLEHRAMLRRSVHLPTSRALSTASST